MWACAVALRAFALGTETPAKAGTITWTTWTSATAGNSWSAARTIGSVGVTYNGQVTYFYTNYPRWAPASTYEGGAVGNAPSPHNILRLTGGANMGIDTVLFSQAVVDPVMAILSLGAGGDTAQFVFTSANRTSS